MGKRGKKKGRSNTETDEGELEKRATELVACDNRFFLSDWARIHRLLLCVFLWVSASISDFICVQLSDD